MSAGTTVGRSGQKAPSDNPLDQPVEVGFLDVDFAAVDGVDDRSRHVHSGNFAVCPRNDGSGRQADIAEVDDVHFGLGLCEHAAGLASTVNQSGNRASRAEGKARRQPAAERAGYQVVRSTIGGLRLVGWRDFWDVWWTRDIASARTSERL
jgi:hypothetical protein